MISSASLTFDNLPFAVNVHESHARRGLQSTGCAVIELIFCSIVARVILLSKAVLVRPDLGSSQAVRLRRRPGNHLLKSSGSGSWKWLGAIVGAFEQCAVLLSSGLQGAAVA